MKVKFFPEEKRIVVLDWIFRPGVSYMSFIYAMDTLLHFDFSSFLCL